MRRIERLINLIIALLETRRPMTAAEIRRRVAGYDQETIEAFRRAFERDKGSLRDMGIPVEVRKVDPLDEHSDGYWIPKERYYLPRIDLEPDELAALRIATDALLGGDPASSGLRKLSLSSATTPVEVRRVVWGADLLAGGELLGDIYEAQLERHTVSFTYTAATGEATRRTVRPYGMRNRRGHWYVIGLDLDRNDIRSFRATRIGDPVETLPETFEIPGGFDADEHLPDAMTLGDEPFDAVVRFAPEMRWWAEQNLAGSAPIETPEGGAEVTLRVANISALVSWVLGFGDRAEIMSPKAARAAVLDHLAPFKDIAG